jgi:hypothetical protein
LEPSLRSVLLSRFEKQNGRLLLSGGVDARARVLTYVTAPSCNLCLILPVITDPLFYLLAVPAVTLLGLGKGGFAGVGMISTPLLALVLPPLQGAAILLPIRFSSARMPFRCGPTAANGAPPI